MKLKRILNEIILEGRLTYSDLRSIEKYVDLYFNKLGLDVEFTKHFLDRVNDPRNKKQITSNELTDMFKDLYTKYGTQITKHPDNFNAVIKDIQTDINCPFVINFDTRENDIDLVMKTVMRKKNFRTSNKVYKV